MPRLLVLPISTILRLLIHITILGLFIHSFIIENTGFDRIPRDLCLSFSNIILIDYQSAIKSISRPRQQSGQHVILEIIGTINEIEARTGMTTNIWWVPAHCNILGNESANKAARDHPKHEPTHTGMLPLEERGMEIGKAGTRFN